jgi:DNA-binding SARP family transcriptional activator
MGHLSIRVFGPFEVCLDGVPASGFSSDKVRALLAYLVLSQGRPHRREALAGLLWPEFPERSARTNLRNALANLRRVIGDREALPPFLCSTRQTIQFNAESDYWMDADAFEGLLGPVSPDRERLEQAVSMARGSLLEGFTLADAAPFEDWLLLLREHYGRQLVEALDKLAVIHEARGDFVEAITHARRRVELEPWQEDGQRQLMRLMAQSGQRSEALARYELLRRSLWEELGAEPMADTKALQEAILDGELEPAPEQRGDQSAPLWSLPATTTPFFGREDELVFLDTKLSEPATRLVTLTGLGGSGKTRLALEAGSRLVEREQQALDDQLPLRYRHGIVFVPLAGLESVDGLPPALADALGFRLEGGQEQLLAFLRRRELLLILDNLEQLQAAKGLLAEFLRVAPGVRILATSRERLQLQGEHVLQLGGLPYPEQVPEPSQPRAVEETPSLAEYPALELLADSARRIRSDYVPSTMELPAMLGVCRLVDGLPLALELAASWADALSFDDILVEAHRSLDFWQVEWSDLPERQRSIRAVFDVSWRRLSPAEKASFSALTVFRGGFTMDAAVQVLGGAAAPVPRLLAALVRKSFLQCDRQRDLYTIHELLRQYGAEKLAREPALEARARDGHSAFYARRLKRWYADMVGAGQHAALLEMEAESDNISAGWSWAVERGKIRLLDMAMEGLERFYWQSGRFRQAEAAYQAAAASAADRAAGDYSDRVTALRVWVRALTHQTNYLRALGLGEEARRIQQRCLAILKDPALAGSDTRLERGMLTFTMGITDCMDDYELGRQRFQEAYALYSKVDFRWGMVGALNAWGTMSMFLGAHEDAERRLGDSLAVARSMGHQSGAANALGRLALVAWVQGRFEDAEVLARESFREAAETGTKAQAAMGHLNLGEVLDKVGEFAEAHVLLEDSLVLWSHLGHQNYTTQVHSFLGSSDLHLGRYREARDHAETGLALAREHGPRFCIGLNSLLIGCLDLIQGAYESANRRLLDSVSVYRDAGQRDDLSWALAALGLASHWSGDTEGARQHLVESLQIALDLGAVPPLLWALPAVAIQLADQGKAERAVELYSLASHYPFVAKSRWFEDVVGQQICATAATLPSEVAAEARERGRSCDLERSAAEFQAELGCWVQPGCTARRRPDIS